MKKSSLLFALPFLALGVNAQVTLTGSSYTQNFNGLRASGLPAGWTVYTGATSSSLGTIKSLSSTLPALPFERLPDTGCSTPDNCAGLVRAGGFKNFPSANSTALTPAVNFCPACTEDTGNFTDRALGVRQVGQTNSSFPNSDGGTGGGAAFVLRIANTTGIRNFTMDFKLQSLDTASHRTTVWTVDYGFGSSPTAFTAATATGTVTTGNGIFSNNPVSVNFGTALDNQSQPVWIRIVSLASTTGSGNRASTAIDDVTLSYVNKVGVEDITAQSSMSLIVLGSPTSDKIDFAYNAIANGNLILAIYDLSGRVIRKEEIRNNAGTYTASDLNLVPGMYIAKISNENGTATAKVMVK